MILIVFGTRPEFIKIKPLIAEMKKRGLPFKTLFTRQHKDIVSFNSDYFFEMENTKSDNRLNCILSDCIVSDEIWKNGITHVLVQGDTSSALGIALSAFNNKIKIIHLEAGLRTYNKYHPYPEEMNRQIISRIADINFCPTSENRDNLISEKASGKIFVVGNTGLDNLVHLKDKCSYSRKILVTLHRRENHESIPFWFEIIEELAQEYHNLEFVLPIHPNPNVSNHSKILKKTNVVEPMDHQELLENLVKCSLVITDSGGIQEECSFLNKKCLVCRETTERPEAISKTTFLVPEPSKLKQEFKKHISNPEVISECPFGDGNASMRICDILKNEI